MLRATRSAVAALGADACSAVSLALGEPLPGTATEAARWLLLEQPGPWGRKAFVGSRLSPEVATAITRRCDELGMRAQLVRRETAGPRRACFVADTSAATLRRLDVNDPREILDADLDRDGEVLQTPLCLVCTNASRDACCAVHGRAVVRALADAGIRDVWETSHVGGHRFAANLLCLPHGFLHGRLRPGSAVRVAGMYARGSVDVGQLRGRTCWPAPVQSAEWFVRQEAGLYGVDDVGLESHREMDGQHNVVMTAAGYRWTLELTASPADPPRIESCGADELVRPVVWSLTAIEAYPSARTAST